MGLLYKVHISVYRNRSIEPNATLYDAKNNVLLSYRVRLHGFDYFNQNASWPHYSNTIGLN